VAGWSFTIQGDLDLKRHIVYVCIADEAQAEAMALKAVDVPGVIIERKQLEQSVMSDLALNPRQHKLQAGDHGWSFTMQGPTAADSRLVVVYLSDEQEAEAIALKIMSGTIVGRSKVPPSVLADLRLQPGGTTVV
jgi:hypothetical protein